MNGTKCSHFSERPEPQIEEENRRFQCFRVLPKVDLNKLYDDAMQKRVKEHAVWISQMRSQTTASFLRGETVIMVN